MEHNFAGGGGGEAPAERTADGTGVRLFRRQNGGELRTAYGCTDGHGGGVADPGDDEREEGQEHIRGRPRQRVTAVADGDQERQHAGRIDTAEQRDRYARERAAHRTPSHHRDDQRYHQPDGSQIERPLTSVRSEEHTSELQSRLHLVCRLLLEKKNTKSTTKRRRRCSSPGCHSHPPAPLTPTRRPGRLTSRPARDYIPDQPCHLRVSRTDTSAS